MNRRDFIGAVATALPLLPSLMLKRTWRVAERIGDTMYGTDVETGCVVELQDTSRGVRIGNRQFIANGTGSYELRETKTGFGIRFPPFEDDGICVDVK